jgi:hypothetical protein
MKTKTSKKFVWLSGDVCWEEHGGSWVRFRGGRDAHVIEIYPNDEGEGPKYYVSLKGVRIQDADDGKISSEYGIEEINDFARADWLFRRGSYAPLGEFPGNNFNKLLREARARSRELDDEVVEEEAMREEVNKIGSTAKEFQAGDINAAILRGLAMGDKNAELMAKLGRLTVHHVGDREEQ